MILLIAPSIPEVQRIKPNSCRHFPFFKGKTFQVDSLSSSTRKMRLDAMSVSDTCKLERNFGRAYQEGKLFASERTLGLHFFIVRNVWVFCSLILGLGDSWSS
jgi:hypothetical protein